MTNESTINPLMKQIERAQNGQYCHALEVEDVHELMSVIESIIEQAGESHSEAVIIDFFQTLDLYCLSDDGATEREIYDFSFRDYIKGTV